MGGQPFGTDAMHLDTSGLRAVGDLDSARGLVDVQAGVVWPELMAELDSRQADAPDAWCIVQKQTGADHLSIGGALSANMHGRALALAPFVQDIESFCIVDPSGEQLECSRSRNGDLFSLAIGGYGLFGIVTQVRLRLMRRRVLRRSAVRESLDRIPELVERRISEGALYGDFQFLTAPEAEGFMREGAFSTYDPEEGVVEPGAAGNRVLSAESWKKLIALAHVDKQRAFSLYLDHYLATDGQLYASDRQQMSTYLPDYHSVVAEAVKPKVAQSLVITELYVPRAALRAFFEAVRADFREHDVDLVYGVVRWIEEDRETFLPWAQGRMACVIFNLNVRHDEAGLAKAQTDFRRLIDRALDLGGSYYLTYHRHATSRQVEAAHPRFLEWLAEKERRDPHGRLQSDWHRHYCRMFGA